MSKSSSSAASANHLISKVQFIEQATDQSLCRELVSLHSGLVFNGSWKKSTSVMVTLASHKEGGHDAIIFEIDPWTIGTSCSIDLHSFRDTVMRRLLRYFDEPDVVALGCSGRLDGKMEAALNCLFRQIMVCILEAGNDFI